ncbi:hypothetical protein BGAFAR04_B0019 (plasmid) [Borreliella garinii Far04]|nr:hypothetical protein BGAFAR04_B0019 [Borreliella garinii Far04]
MKKGFLSSKYSAYCALYKITHKTKKLLMIFKTIWAFKN